MGLGLNIGIDLRDITVIILSGQGIVLGELAVVALQQDRQVLAVGEVLADAGTYTQYCAGDPSFARQRHFGFQVTEVMLKSFINRVNTGFLARYFKPTIVVCVPSVITQVETRAVEDACRHAGAKEVYLIREPVAAAIGAGIDITQASGSMVVDIGGGTTDIAVISLCQPVVDSSIKVAGDKFDDAIIKYVRRKYNVLIGEQTAEELKKNIGCAYPREEELTMEVRGRNLITGMPATLALNSTRCWRHWKKPVSQILKLCIPCWRGTPPELMADISQRGLVMAGGGALLYGLDLMLAAKIGIEVLVAEDAESCVAVGTGLALGIMEKFGDLAD